MQWDKFSTDSEKLLKTLETELLTALVDHINDKRYYTYAPITLQVKPDYFTNGIKLFAGFEKTEDERETAIDVSMPGFTDDLVLDSEDAPAPLEPTKVIIRFDLDGRTILKELTFEEGKRITFGRTRENDVAVDDVSVSKMHASVMLNSEGQFVVADTGSTNGTFIDGGRISYGKAATFSAGQKLKLGTVELTFDIVAAPEAAKPEPAETEAFKIGEFEFSGKVGGPEENRSPALADTVAGIEIPESEIKSEHDANKPETPKAGIELNLPEDESAISK
jgi:pSer/pThr/pTyr-binding forkhead associated (FHA) protein